MDFLNIVITLIVVIIIVRIGFIYLNGLGDFDLTCIVSSVDGHKYCVRERSKVKEAVDLLASTVKQIQTLIESLKQKFGSQDNVKRLVAKFNPDAFSETLPTSTYTAYSENKGERVAFCLNEQKNDNDVLIDAHTLMFVALHELSHVMSVSTGHNTEFWDNFKFLLVEAKSCGIHDPVDYGKSPKNYCGMTIHDNPYYGIV